MAFGAPLMETGGEKATSKDQGHLPYLITSGLLEFQVCALAKKANLDFTRAKKVFTEKTKEDQKFPHCVFRLLHFPLFVWMNG